MLESPTWRKLDGYPNESRCWRGPQLRKQGRIGTHMNSTKNRHAPSNDVTTTLALSYDNDAVFA